MRPITGWQRKLRLLFQTEKRLGATELAHDYEQKNRQQMKQTLVTVTTELPDYENKRVKDLYGHLEHLKQEFIGQPELCYYHTVLIVLLRRDYQPRQTFAKFLALWEKEADYLLDNLSLRWIISACDTFIDWSDDPVKKSILLSAVTMVNTLRICETQMFLGYADEADKTKVLDDKLQQQLDRQWALYDGLTYFRAGGDDTLMNMRLRFESFSEQDELAGKILIKVFERLHQHDNAFSMMKDLQQGGRYVWWTDR